MNPVKMEDTESEVAMSCIPSTFDFFSGIESELKKDRDLRDEIRAIVMELEECSRQTETVMQGVHQSSCEKQKEICAKARTLLVPVKEWMEKLKFKVPQDDFYRVHGMWQTAFTKLCFLTSLIIFIESDMETMATKGNVAEMLGLKTEREDGFHLELDDYLLGLLFLVNELSRLAMNSVTSGNMGAPLKISNFVSNLESGFRLLNLKNDFLRKKYDGLKYDVKKIEQVVYDMKIRGLIAKT